MNAGQHMKHVGFEVKDFLKAPPRAELLPGVARWLHNSASELHCPGVGCAARRFVCRAGGGLSRVAWLRDGQESFRACEACVCLAVESWCVVCVMCVPWLLQRTHSREGTWLTCARSFKATKLPRGTFTLSWGRGLCARSQRAGVRAVLEVCSYHGATYVSKSRRSVLQKPIPPPAPALCSFEGFRS